MAEMGSFGKFLARFAANLGNFFPTRRELLPEVRELFPSGVGNFWERKSWKNFPVGRRFERALWEGATAKCNADPPASEERIMDRDGGNSRRPTECETCDDLLLRLDPLIRSVVARFTLDRATADELAQACRIRIYERRGQCRDPEAVFGWARTLCRRVCINAAGTERRDRDRFVEDMDGTASAESTVPDPLAAVETKELRLRVRTAVERLSAEQRRLLFLRYWHGLSVAEIARRLNLPEATVRTRLRRARLRLRRAPEIVCYAPRLPSLWSQKSGNGMMDEAPTSASPLSDGMGVPTEVMR